MTYKSTASFLIFLVLFISFSSLTSCGENKTVPATKTEITFKKEGELQLIKASNDSILQAIDIEIADNNYERETGLMYRKSLEGNHGMLFIFEQEQYLAFYMKNTHISLDILYINNKLEVVDIYESTTPLNDMALPSKSMAKYVLELNAGKVSEWNIAVGDGIAYKVLK